MESFFENTFARMYGPHFLIFYAVFIVFVVLFINYFVPRIIKGSKHDDFKPEIPMHPDPYEIAYLRGGEQEVAMLGIFILITRGYLKILTNMDKTDVWIGKKTTTPGLNALNKYETTLLGLVNKKEKSILQLMKSTKTSDALKDCCQTIKKKLETEQLLSGEEGEMRFKRWQAICIGSIVLVGFYKMAAALSHGHSNVFFLIVLGVIGGFIISNLKMNMLSSGSGKKYLEQLQSVFKPNKDLDVSGQPLYYQQLQLAIFGMALLETTKYAYLSNYYKSNFNKKDGVYWDGPEYGGGGSYGGSGSCSSGSSCGSSCGGCGGCS